jgi:hypothetical protein
MFGVRAESDEFAFIQMINVLSELPNTKWLALLDGLSSLLFLLFAKFKLKTRLGPIVLCFFSTIFGLLVFDQTYS